MAALPPTSVPPVGEGDTSEPAFSADVDALLDPSERAQRTAWFAHVESALGDLVVRPFAYRSALRGNLRYSLGLCLLLADRKLRCGYATHAVIFLQNSTVLLRAPTYPPSAPSSP